MRSPAAQRSLGRFQVSDFSTVPGGRSVGGAKRGGTATWREMTKSNFVASDSKEVECAQKPAMESLQKQLTSASNLPREGAKPPQIEAFKAAIIQVRSALENDCAALISSSAVKTLFTKSIGAAIAFNRSDSRLENDSEQGALFESIATIEEVVKIQSAEAALLKAGVVKAVPHLLSVLLGTDDDVECREAAVSCLCGAPHPAFAPRPACGPRPAGCKHHTGCWCGRVDAAEDHQEGPPEDGLLRRCRPLACPLQVPETHPSVLWQRRRPSLPRASCSLSTRTSCRSLASRLEH